MTRIADTRFVREQYATSANLDARIALHKNYSTATQDFHDWLFEHISLPRDARVLEVGCGSGALWERVQGRIPVGWRLTLTDFSLGMARTVQGKFADARFSFAQADGQALPFADETFDGVLANHMLYHVPNLDRTLGEIRRTLKPGGMLAAATNGAEHLRELRALIASVSGETPTLDERGFSLENGGTELAKYFEQVTLVEQECDLRVTDAEPLVAYVLSGAPFDVKPVSTQQVEGLRERIQQEIDDKGAFFITKRVGVFVAVKGSK